MVVVPDLQVLHNRIAVEFFLPLEDELHVVPVQAEHIWFNEGLNGWYHGFRFVEIEKEKQEIFISFLARCRRHLKKS
jgi:hypothetical protein